jgi:hypothetical protein
MINIVLCDLISSKRERRYYKIKHTAPKYEADQRQATHVLLFQLFDVRKQSTQRSVLQNCLITSSGLQFVNGDKSSFSRPCYKQKTPTHNNATYRPTQQRSAVGPENRD